MSNAKWRPSTSVIDVSQSTPETYGAASRLQSVLDRLKPSPSLPTTQTAAEPTGSPSGLCDVHETRSRSPRRDVGPPQRSSARCRSSASLGRWQPGPGGSSGRQSSGTPRSAERRRSRYSDVTETGERPPLTDRSEVRRSRRSDTAADRRSDTRLRTGDLEQGTDDAGEKDDVSGQETRRKGNATERAADTAERRDGTTPRRAAVGSRRGAMGGRRTRYLAPADTSQSALSSSADSSVATSTSAALTPPDSGTQVSLTADPATGPQTPRLAPGSAACRFQARPRREPAPNTAKQPPAERVADNVNKKQGGIPPIVRKTLMDFDRIQKLKYAAETAMREKKVFMIHGGYPSIRLALKRRGWVEKKYLINRTESEDDIDVSRWPIDTDGPGTGLGLADVLGLKGSKNSMILTRLLKDHQPNLIWSARREVIDYVSLERDQLVNHFPRAPFNTKVGLCSLAQNLHWYSESLSADTFIPRAFRIGIPEEKLEFVEDFRLTACAGLLVWFRERYELHGAAGVEDDEGEVPYSVIPTALQQCQAYIASRQHEDIEPCAFNRALWPHQWDNFLTNVYKVVHRSKKLEKHRDESSTIVKVFYNRVTSLLSELVKHRPQTLLDGWLNIWIVKPGCSSRGRGIILLRQLEDILALVDSATQREGKYVVQKYIERPMLIYNTKFDIRQWFLVTDWNPLTVWMYKQSYLRFCSQQFTLGDLKEAVHLCNNAVQARYRNGERHAALPTENMWDSSTFQQFLKSREAGHAWDQIIYPAMKSAIISLCLASQTELEPRKGCFELFGADFLLTEDFRPWLIEVNSSPAMGATTSVTAWLCAMCLEDVIRVIVDRRRDSRADVGEFECILQQPPVSSPRYLGIDLSVHGHRLKPPAAAAASAAVSAAGPAPPAAGSEAPVTPRSPSVAPSAMGRASEVLTRLTSLPKSAAASAAAVLPVQRLRSRSQATRTGPSTASVPVTAVSSPANTAASTAATAAASPTGTSVCASTPPRRNRSVSQAAPASRRAAPAPAAQPSPPLPPPPASQPAAQRLRQKPAGKRKAAAAARRRSRTQVIQNSVRRLSDPRRIRGDQQWHRPPPPSAAPCAVPRRCLEVAGRRREAPSPRAQQLVTCDRLQEPLTPGRLGQTADQRRRDGGGGTGISVTSLPAGQGGSAERGTAGLSATSLQPEARHSPAGSGSGPGSGGQRLEETAAAAQREPARPEPEHQRPAAETVLAVTGSNYISSSLDKLARIRLASEDAVRRITSLSLSPAAPAAAEDCGSSVEEVQMKQTGKVKWVAMSAAQTSQPAPPTPIRFPAASVPAGAPPALRTASAATGDVTPTPEAASPAAQTASQTPRPASPAPRTTPPEPRTLSPVLRAPSPIPRTPSPVPRAGAPVSSPVSPAPRTVDSPRTTSLTVSPASSLRPASDPASWSTARQSPVPTSSLAPASAPAPAPVVTSAGGGASGALPSLSPPPSGHHPAAFNARITELKTLIDRAIEETREFLGRSRGSPVAAPLVPTEPAPAAVTAPPSPPRASLSPTIVDIAVRRPSGSSAAWELAAAEVPDSPRTGSGRSGARRGSPAAAAAGAAAGRSEPPPRPTELVGLQGRRFLPQLNGPEPPPPHHRSR